MKQAVHTCTILKEVVASDQPGDAHRPKPPPSFSASFLLLSSGTLCLSFVHTSLLSLLLFFIPHSFSFSLVLSHLLSGTLLLFTSSYRYHFLLLWFLFSSESLSCSFFLSPLPIHFLMLIQSNSLFLHVPFPFIFFLIFLFPPNFSFPFLSLHISAFTPILSFRLLSPCSFSLPPGQAPPHHTQGLDQLVPSDPALLLIEYTTPSPFQPPYL